MAGCWAHTATHIYPQPLAASSVHVLLAAGLRLQFIFTKRRVVQSQCGVLSYHLHTCNVSAACVASLCVCMRACVCVWLVLVPIVVGCSLQVRL